MVRASLVVHWLLAAYLWLLAFVSLGHWNAQAQPHLLAAVRSGHSLSAGDAGLLGFTMLPAVLFTAAWLWRSLLLTLSALTFDLIWLAMQVQSWWIPYAFAIAKPWQVRYADGATTKVLPSFGLHVAPDGMHLGISLLLIAALWTGLRSVRRIRLDGSKARAHG